MIEADASSMGTSWLGTASRPRVAMTAERPSNSGIPAATAAPKTTSRMPSVSGTAVNSARWKSDAIVSSTDFSPLAEPNPSTVKPALAASIVVDGGENGLDPVDGAHAGVVQLVLHEHGLAVRGDELRVVERRADAGDAVRGVELRDDVVDDRLELGARSG